MRILFWTALWTFVLDQVSKYLVVQWMDLRTELYLPIVEPFLVFQMAWNRGVNFGLFAGYDATLVLIIIALVITAGVLYWMWRDGGSRWAMLSAGLLVGGALGNVLDRVVYGAVADFINMSCCGIQNPYAFNVADVSIFIGAVGLILFTGNGDQQNTTQAKGRTAKRNSR